MPEEPSKKILFVNRVQLRRYCMEFIQSFSLLRSADENEVTSKLFYQGTDTGSSIHGCVLDRQFKTDSYYVLFANYDCPFEESCEITLLNTQLKVVGHKSVGAWYSSYWLESVEVLSNDEFRLGFHGDIDFLLSVNFPRSLRWKFFGWQTLKLKRVESD